MKERGDHRPTAHRRAVFLVDGAPRTR
jgi:hypothetical protein